MHRISNALILASLISAPGLIACESTDAVEDGEAGPVASKSLRPPEVILGVAAYLGSTDVDKQYAPLNAYLAEAIGRPVKLWIAPSYGGLVEGLRGGTVHLALLSPLNYVGARAKLEGLAPMVSQMSKGSSSYSAAIVAKLGRDVKSLRDLKGARFAFVDQQSTSGYLYPLAYLRSMGHEPESFFSEVLYLGNHGAVVDAVLAGRVDAGATFSMAHDVLEAKGLQRIAKTGRIPYDALCAHPNLDSAWVEKLTTALVALDAQSPMGKRVLQEFSHIDGFKQVDDSHYADVRRILRRAQTSTVTP